MLRQRKEKDALAVVTIPFSDCPAKTYLRPEGGTIPGRSVVEHCQIVGEVARALIQRYPQGLQHQLFPQDAPFAAACHDIGKVSPYFVEKIRRACTAGLCALPPLNLNPELERQWGGHAGVSQVAAKALGAPPFVAEILGQHHGFSPSVAANRENDEIFGAAPWQEQREALLLELKGLLGMDWPQMASVEQARIVAGLTSVADWIGSGQHFEDPSLPWRGSVETALDEAGFIPPLYCDGLSFKQVFGFEPRPAQSQLIEAVSGPGVYVLEAPMGLGKTEAALYAAYRILTSDQALMAAMNVKHGFVRAFGLAGKVVILDEVHTYDAYTGTLLDALVELLRGLHCTVIILSATLSQERRRHLLNAELSSHDYPLITAAPRQQAVLEYPVGSGAGQQVTLRLLEQNELAIQEALDRAFLGQQVLWIENTVNDAQQRYLDLAARASELGLASGLLHSRFSVDDRQRIEAHWVDLFGKRGWSQRGKKGRILVGTQVLEQSLDIDADFLVSRFAPSDMLLQRLGRLWRHAETPRAASARCEAWLLAPELEAAIATPQAAFGSSAYVYSPYVLCRSLEVWRNKVSLHLPGDIRSLIEQTYSARTEEGAMARWLYELDNGTQWRKGRNALRQLARIGLAEGGKTLPESQAQTRYSETDSHELLLLRSMNHLPHEKATRLVLLDGRQLTLPWQRRCLTKQQWRQLTAALMSQVVPVRVSDAPLPLSIDTLKKFHLQHCFYLGDPNWTDDESLLRVALVDESGALLGVQGARVHDKYLMDYRDDLGYRVIKD